MNFSDCVVPVKGYHSETQARLWQPSRPPSDPNPSCPSPSSSLLPLAPYVTVTLQLCPAGSAIPAAVLTLTPALFLPFIITFSLNQGSS